MATATQKQVFEFLLLVKDLVLAENRSYFRKVVAETSTLGVTLPEMWEIIQSLQIDHYCHGPQRNLDTDDADVYVFVTGNNAIYIKLEVLDDHSEVVVMSFKQSTGLMFRPFRRA